MIRHGGLRVMLSLAISAIALTPVLARAQAPDPTVMLAAERAAMAPLAYMDGVWRGPAWTILPSGVKHEVTQTERIGPFLDGTVRVLEGRGYNADGTVGFNAFGTISWNPMSKEFTLHSYAQGFAGDFRLMPTADGYVWEIPAGPATIRYTTVIKNGIWHEVGDRIVPGQAPARFFEMTLTRVGDTDWPAAGAVPNSSTLRPEHSVATHARGTFDVKVTPIAPDIAAGSSPLGRMTLDKQFHGDLDATSKGEMLSAGSPATGTAGYVAIEHVTGRLGGHAGSFALQHWGTMSGGEQELRVAVVPGSGTGELAGLSGTMTIVIADGKHSYDFDYTLKAAH